MKLSKRRQAIVAKVTPGKFIQFRKPCNLLKEFATAKFVESVDVAINLGIDSRKSDQGVRGAVVLPHGTGRQVRVAVFAQGDKAAAARAAGADMVALKIWRKALKAANLPSMY